MAPTRSSRRGGFSAVEVIIALSVLAVALMAIISAMGGASAVRVQDRSLVQVSNEINAVLERYRGMEPETLIAQLQAGGATIDAEGDLAFVETNYADPQHTPKYLPSAGLRIELLCEKSTGLLLGLPVGSAPDFDGNADENNCVFAAYRGVAPVRVTMTWRPTPTQVRTQSVWTVLYRRDT